MNDERKGGVLAWFDSVEKIAVALAAVVALIGATVALVLKLIPDPGPPPPPREVTMTISGPDRVQLIDYLFETGQERSGYSEAELRQFGNEYVIKIHADGLSNKTPEVVWNLRGDPLPSDLPEDLRKQWFHQFLRTLTPSTDPYTNSAKVWIQSPPYQGTYFAEIAIEYPEYEILATATTSDFRGRRQRREPSQGTVTQTTVTTIPATVTTSVTTIEGTETVTTTTDGTTTTSTVPTHFPVTTTTTIPARTTTVMRTVSIPGPVPIVRPKAKIVRP